jgi:hypothetical protein
VSTFSRLSIISVAIVQPFKKLFESSLVILSEQKIAAIQKFGWDRMNWIVSFKPTRSSIVMLSNGWIGDRVNQFSGERQHSWPFDRSPQS